MFMGSPTFSSILVQTQKPVHDSERSQLPALPGSPPAIDRQPDPARALAQTLTRFHSIDEAGRQLPHVLPSNSPAACAQLPIRPPRFPGLGWDPASLADLPNPAGRGLR